MQLVAGCWLLLMTMTTEQENNAGALPALQLSISSLFAIFFLNQIIFPIGLVFLEIVISIMCLSNFLPTDAWRQGNVPVSTPLGA